MLYSKSLLLIYLMPVFHHHCITYQTVHHVVGAQCERKKGWKEGRKEKEGGREE